MKNKGFTLVELLGVIVILSVIMLIAIPNISSTLERSKRDQYIIDAKKLVSLVQYEIRKEGIDKPNTDDGVLVRLSYLATNDVEKDPDGNLYDIEQSYVVVTRDNGYLKYYVNLVTETDTNSYKGIRLVDSDELDGDDRYKLIESGLTGLSETLIKTKTNITGNLILYPSN